MIQITLAGTELRFDEANLHVSMTRNGTDWSWESDYIPVFNAAQREIPFLDAASVSHEVRQTGLGKGILSRYEGFAADGDASVPGLSFCTYVWIEGATGDVFFEWIPLGEEGAGIQSVTWPGPMAFREKREDWYTLLNYHQGLLIPNIWETELGKLPFGGSLCSAASYMPWFGQVKAGEGYIAICEQPWDSAFYAEHPAGGPYTKAGVRWGASLGKMRYRRVMRYTLLSECDYNDICKVYRSYVKEKGLFCSLKEKAAKAPGVERLIGSLFLHRGIKNHVCPESSMYDAEHPGKYDRVVPFRTRTEEIKALRAQGFEKLYLHLDGWGDPGYDNQHPDYLPPCEEAGGWDGMKELADTLHDCGYLFGIHDQYRDYYFDGKTFDASFGCLQTDGTIPEHANWAGGHQTYLCATQAPYYVKRNFRQLAEHDIGLDCAYLDVFTCNEPDECANPMHYMSRRDCLDFRGQCFEYLLSQGILPSSEEVSDWSMKSLVFCHYAPYQFQMCKPGTPRKGIPVPLFNLVYHDCVIIPWMMEKMDAHNDYMLYALLNGGAPYLIRDGAYPGIDGSFQPEFTFTEREAYDRCRVVADLHERIAACEMVSHKLLAPDGSKQETVFSDGTRVRVDLDALSYEICKGDAANHAAPQ
ncbi:DUF5696 domain-containing protein [uncultured Acetatifactor sp.]|uniref:DUF5696 domain-containing protein n=1 Tax=uncultured Acetatifactor sp. TaxID=1671927 RepID=UPI00261680DA|nr:DUF5696 domain-containing protein [uncultured Acetatifactor sp.]